MSFSIGSPAHLQIHSPIQSPTHLLTHTSTRQLNHPFKMSTSDCPGGNRNFNTNSNAQQIVQSIAIREH